MEPPLDESRGAGRNDAAPPVEPPSRRAWILAGSVAAGVFLVFESVAAFVASPLRELSSFLAQIVLGVTGFPVTRHGTILSTPNATFDVVPACSGSTTLQVLLFVAIVWCGVHPRLTPVRRVAAVLLALPLAILANAIRVAALVAAGHILGEELGEFPHALAGLVAFALAMAGCFAVTRRLASAAPGAAVKDRTLTVILAGLLVYLGLPFIVWCLEVWGGRSLDRFGFLFVAAAAAVAVWRWRATPSDHSWEGRGTIGLALSLVGLAAATLVDITILKGLSLIAAFLGLALAAKGIRFAVSMIPVAALAYLGFPTLSYQLGVATSWRFSSLPAFLGMKAFLALFPLLLVFGLSARPAVDAPAPGARRFLPLQLLMIALLAAFQAYYFGFSGSGLQETRLEMSYLQGPWVGSDNEIRGNEKELFGRGRIWSKRYRRDRDMVDVVVTSTGGDRHRAHPPAYCVTGSGWQTVETEVTERRLGDGRVVPVTLMRLRKDGADYTFCYWFTNGTESYAGFSGMMLHDTLRRLGGRRADWFVFRIMTGSGEAALDEFLSTFKAPLSPGVEGLAGP